jgi:glutaredoxin
MKKITIYTSETCPYCNTIKETLEKNDIKFTEKLISEYKEEWGDIGSLTNMSQTPTIIINNEYFVPGRDFFNPEHLINIIKEFKKSKFDYSIRSFERIKSLNFNILTAFNRLDTTLRNIENKLNKEENEHKSTN